MDTTQINPQPEIPKPAPPPSKPAKTFGAGLRIFIIGLAVLIGLSALLGSLLKGHIGETGQKIGVVEVIGVITSSRDIVRQLREFGDDESIHGIILRIDSPGGSVAPSQEIYDAVLKIRKNGKKIFASMGNLGASGGYYIAAAADKIFANPGTLTGSIGVIMAFSNFEELLRKVGLRPEVIKAGKFKDTGSPNRAMTKEERQYLQNVVDDVHSQFVEAIAIGRGINIDEARKLASGRIFTGRQAKELNLIDSLGGLEDAIASLAQTVGIIGRPKIIQEEPDVSPLDWLLKGSISKEIRSTLSPTRFSIVQYLWVPGNPLGIVK